MNKVIVTIIIILLVLLDLAALNDILQGTEPNYTQEYLMIAASVVIFIMLGLGSIIKNRK